MHGDDRSDHNIKERITHAPSRMAYASITLYAPARRRAKQCTHVILKHVQWKFHDLNPVSFHSFSNE